MRQRKQSVIERPMQKEGRRGSNTRAFSPTRAGMCLSICIIAIQAQPGASSHRSGFRE